MAAVTVVSQSERHVFGDLRLISAVVTVANTGDTWAVPGIHSIKAGSTQVSPDTARSCGVTVSGTTITFATSAGNVNVCLFGV